MHTTTPRARRSAHLSRHERQWLARVEAFARGTPVTVAPPCPAKLANRELALIDRLVRDDRTVVSTALLVIAGIDAGAAARRAVLTRVSQAACWAQAEGAISSNRADQIARHVRRALYGRDQAMAA